MQRASFSLPVPPPAPKSLTYSCLLPSSQKALFKVAFTLKDAALGVLLPSTKRFAVEATITRAGGSFLLDGPKTIEGALTLKSTFRRGLNTLPVHVPLAIPQTEVAQPWIATGQTPVINVPGSAQLQWRLDGVALNLRARLSDGTPANLPSSPLPTDSDPSTFDVSCALSPTGQDTLIYPTQPFSVIEN